MESPTARAADSEDLEDVDLRSNDSVDIEEVLQTVVEDGHLSYVCLNKDGSEEVFDRSDLIDGARMQRLVLAFERKYPPPWDDVCEYCDGEGCEECICEECGRKCRHILGINYGCIAHPVV